MPDNIDLRPMEENDHPFLARLFAACRPELAALPLPDEQKAALVDMQCRAQHACYQGYPGIEFLLIVHGGLPVGRLTVQRTPERHAIVDIALLPAWRRRGIGNAVLARFLGEAAAARQPVHLQVAYGNPAQRLYRRLGFQALAEDGVQVQMAWIAV